MIDLRLGNCLELMPTLEAQSIDAVITDAPFGLPNEKFEDVVTMLQGVKYECAAVITDWRNSITLSRLPNKVGELVWEYGWISGGRTRARYGALPTHNTIHLFGNIKRLHFIRGSVIKRAAGFSSPRQCSYAKKSGHPFEKPIALMEYLIKHIDAQTILDPFMGSGTTGVACVRLNRNFIGMEINPTYFEIAQRRITEAQAQMTLNLEGAA